MTSTTTVLDPKTLAGDDGPLRLVLTARLKPVAGLDRFQPAGFPEIGHVIYDSPRADASSEKVCIVDSAASMANHLESVCMRGPHDVDLVDDLAGMPYLRCVTGDVEDGKLPLEKRRLVVTSLTEGHRIASTYFFGNRPSKTRKWDGRGGQRVLEDGRICDKSFGDELAEDGKFGIVMDGNKNAHPTPEAWWSVFSTIFKYDPNALVHGVLFPQWQVKISRVLTAHMEAMGAGRVDSSGVKFDRLGKTTSGQPIFSKDEETAREIRATFILDLALLRSFGRGKKGNNGQKGLDDKQKEFLVAFALWKIGRLVRGPFKYRTGCDLECEKVVEGLDDNTKDDLKEGLTKISLAEFTTAAAFSPSPITDIYWPADELDRPGKDDAESAGEGGEENEDEEAESESEDEE